MAPDRDPREDVLAYLARLDDHLGDMRPGERKLVRRDVRRLLEDMAFRFAFLDDRLAPADLDTARALEAVKSPEAAGRVLLAARPKYRRRARSAAVRSFALLATLVLAVGGLLFLMGTERAVPLGEYGAGRPERTTEVDAVQVDVPEGLDRVYLVVQPRVREGLVTVTVAGPGGDVLYQRSFSPGDTAYEDRNLPAPAGEWTILVDYVDAAANVRVRLTGVEAVVGR